MNKQKKIETDAQIYIYIQNNMVVAKGGREREREERELKIEANVFHNPISEIAYYWIHILTLYNVTMWEATTQGCENQEKHWGTFQGVLEEKRELEKIGQGGNHNDRGQKASVPHHQAAHIMTSAHSHMNELEGKLPAPVNARKHETLNQHPSTELLPNSSPAETV